MRLIKPRRAVLRRASFLCDFLWRCPPATPSDIWPPPLEPSVKWP